MTTAKKGAIIRAINTGATAIENKFFEVLKMKSTNKQQATRTTEQATNTARAERQAEIITAENVERMSEQIALKALKTVIASGKGLTAEQAEKLREQGKDIASGGNFSVMYKIYCGLIHDITTAKNTLENFSDGKDIAQEIAVILWTYNGKPLDYLTDEKNDNGERLTVLRLAFKTANRYIMGERKRIYKTAYIDEINENGECVYHEIPQEWDIPTITDYKTITAIIKQLKLTDTEKKILYYRLRGVAVDDTKKGKNGQLTQKTATSMRTIAEKIGISHKTVIKHLKNIQRKAVEIGLTPKTKSK